MIALAVLVTALAFIAFYLIQARRQIQDLNANLQTNRTDLASVTQELTQSQQEIGGLQEDLSTSQSELGTQGRELNQYKGLYQGLKSEQEQQTRELEAISLQKADQGQVDTLKSETAGIQQQANHANSNIAGLRALSTRNRTDIEANSQTISTVRQEADQTSTELAAVKKSVEREVYNFELYEDGAIMKVFEVALSLKDIDFNRQRYDLEILANGQRIKKDNHFLNEPIYFYVEGVSKPYEIVVNKVDKKYVVGYLSIPKK